MQVSMADDNRDLQTFAHWENGPGAWRSWGGAGGGHLHPSLDGEKSLKVLFESKAELLHLAQAVFRGVCSRTSGWV